MNNDGHVILIDDDPSVRKGLARLLSNAGYKIRQQAHEMNAVGFFRKPIDGCALIDAIDWAIQAEKRKQ